MTSLQKRILVLLSGLLIIGCSKPATYDESKFSGPSFAENIRNTPGHTPEEERQMLKVPDGFEIELFASEPDIQKPLNIAFDSKGRMWVTQSFDYPFPAEPGKGTDHLTLVEDTNNDGKADKFTNFSDTLNIPIGVFPLEDGALTFSIPNIYRLTDNNKDGRADASKILYGPFGYEDTHGMVSNFMRGYDGWIHGSHGFTNNSKVSGSDHDSIHMISGNTYRFRIDGSRIEQMTFGQVNPFGIAYDEWGYVYTTDSHSSPLYQLITGGDYPHFGKLEIMAFGPDMKPLVDEATALCGIAYYGDTKFPKEFQGNLFIGDVINSRVHRYSSVNKGSSPIGKQEEALVKSADPWFRPVNVKLGPDGAIYVADFYNPIIGHYEVPLGHPLRDKNHGRIWRITYKGNTNKVDDISNAPADQLIAKLDHDNIAVRLQATDQLTDRIGAAAMQPINELLANSNTSTRQYIHGIWILQRLHSLTPDLIQKSAIHTNEMIRVHTMRILKEEPSSPESQTLAVKGMQDSSPHVQRAAAELLVAYADQKSVKALLAVLHVAPAEDTHLVYTCRLVLRNVLRNETLMRQVLAAKWNPEETKWIAGTLVDVYSVPAGLFLAKNIGTNPLPPEKMGLAYQQIARFIPPRELDGMLTRVMADKSKSIEERSSIIKGVRQGIAQRGGSESPKFQQWGSTIAQELAEKYPATDTEVSDEVANLQKLAFDLAGAYKVKELTVALGTYVTAGGESRNDVKAAAFNALLKIEPANTAKLAGRIIMDNSASLDFRKKVATTLSAYPGSAVNRVLANVKNLPPDLEIAVAVPLASTAEGRAILFKKIKAGEMAARTLRNPRVRDRLMLKITPKEQKQYDELTANLGEISAEKDALIADRLKSFRAAKLSAAQLDSGSMLFNNNCGVCHRRVSRDAIGPPLAGIGKRGDYALAEKILDPNRNVTEAFRNYTIRMKDGKVFSGVYRRDEGAVAIYADLTGTEFSIVKKDVAERKASAYTVMPDTFGSTLTQNEFNALLATLLEW